tara:strand:- start:461 stop:616 length:156 start_codon:yes stop_codon:yes gene_type:complete
VVIAAFNLGPSVTDIYSFKTIANKVAKRAYNDEKIVFEICQRKQKTLQIKN